jgi:small conductance mechanosensitive channel
MPPTIALALPAVAAMPASMKAALPALSVLLVNGARDLLAAIIILALGWTLARWFGHWLQGALGRIHIVDDTLKPLIATVARYSILAITLVAVLGQFGIQTTSLIALLGAAGLAIGLALQGTLSNVASGVMLLALRPIRAHDRVDIGGVIGTLNEVGLFRTILVSDDGIYISIPNATVFSATISNYSREAVRRVTFTVDIDHADDIALAQKTVQDAILRDTRVLAHPAPAVVVDALNGVATILAVQAWLANKDFSGAQSDLRREVRHALTEAGIRPPVPFAAVPPPPRSA